MKGSSNTKIILMQSSGVGFQVSTRDENVVLLTTVRAQFTSLTDEQTDKLMAYSNNHCTVDKQ